MNDLAIIIPAYKRTFLKRALDSIAAQTCSDFTVYIGDDCSPYDLKSIIEPYCTKFNLVYKKFATNLGGADLVSQWKRCIGLSKNESWLWLFSDDDEMEKTCVESFYRALKNTRSEYDVYHFDVNIINEKSEICFQPRNYPICLDGFTYYKNKMKGKIVSLVVENIFSRKVYNEMCGFENFDLAWGSDTATWVKFSNQKGIYTIPEAKVLWRRSNENISPNTSVDISIRKVNALVDFFLWINNFYQGTASCKLINSIAFIQRMRGFKKMISREQTNDCIDRFCKGHQLLISHFFIKCFIKI